MREASSASGLELCLCGTSHQSPHCCDGEHVRARQCIWSLLLLLLITFCKQKEILTLRNSLKER